MFDEERMIGEYEVIQSTHIGARELVVGVYSDNQYMCGFYVENEILGNCTDVVVSEDYLDIMTVYAERLQHQVQAVIAERKTVKVPLTPLTVTAPVFMPEGAGLDCYNFIQEVPLLI